MYYKTRPLVQPRTLEEVEILVFECSWALQTMSNRSGYSPAQRVFGRNPQLQLDLTGDGGTCDFAPTVDEAMERAAEMRKKAQQALVEHDAKLRVARAANVRPLLARTTSSLKASRCRSTARTRPATTTLWARAWLWCSKAALCGLPVEVNSGVVAKVRCSR